MFDEHNIKKQSRLPAAAVIILIFILAGLFIYRGNLEAELAAATRSFLGSVMEQQGYTFSSKMQDQKDAIKIYADFFEYSNPDEITLQEKLTVINDNSTFDYVTYAELNGDALENTGRRINLSDRDYFRRAMAEETVITEPVVSKATGTNIVNIATPIYSNGEVSGVLVGVYSVENLSHLLMQSFGGQGYTYITNSLGDVVVKTKTDNALISTHSNIFDALKTVRILDPSNYEIVKAQMQANQSGDCRYIYKGEERIMCYMPIGINDWYIFTAAPSEAIAPQIISIMYSTTVIMLVISLLFALSVVYVFIVQRSHMQELRKLAFVDSLTGMANRKSFTISAAELLKTKKDKCFAFVLMDIDKFKVLNDTLGYTRGDALLRAIAQILKKQMQEDEAFGRCDSDEYLLLLHYTDDQAIEARLGEIIKAIETDFVRNIDSGYNLVLCVGVYVIQNPDEPINSISDRTRHAHRLIKGCEQSSISFYNEEIRNAILHEKVIENKMHAALRNGEFALYLQPKYFLETHTIYGGEALVRWNVENSVLVYPNDFIPIFEKNGFITKLDMYMMDSVCAVIRQWIDTGLKPVPVSINFSRLHLKNPNFVVDIAKIAGKYGIPPSLIEVEITESAMLNNETLLIAVLEQLHDYGFTLSMDDFGSGYSSLGLLKNLPVDVVKLDRTFLADKGDTGRAKAVISSIISMAEKLGIDTVAEGVETQEQIDMLTELGCRIVQGYYFAKPMPEPEFKKLL